MYIHIYREITAVSQDHYLRRLLSKAWNSLSHKRIIKQRQAKVKQVVDRRVALRQLKQAYKALLYYKESQLLKKARLLDALLFYKHQLQESAFNNMVLGSSKQRTLSQAFEMFTHKRLIQKKAIIMGVMLDKYSYKADLKARFNSYLQHRIFKFQRKAFSALMSNYYTRKQKEHYLQGKNELKNQGGVFYGWFEAATRRITVKNSLAEYSQQRELRILQNYWTHLREITQKT